MQHRKESKKIFPLAMHNFLYATEDLQVNLKEKIPKLWVYDTVI